MILDQTLCIVGILLIVIGSCIEITAFAAMASYRIRRSLPIQSPIPLQAAGCWVFTLGSIVLLASHLIFD